MQPPLHILLRLKSPQLLQPHLTFMFQQDACFRPRFLSPMISLVVQDSYYPETPTVKVSWQTIFAEQRESQQGCPKTATITKQIQQHTTHPTWQTCGRSARVACTANACNPKSMNQNHAASKAPWHKGPLHRALGHVIHPQTKAQNMSRPADNGPKKLAGASNIKVQGHFWKIPVLPHH